jgi:hypothetical protein
MLPPDYLINAVAKVPEWFPGAGFKRIAREWHETLEEMVSAPYKLVKDQMVANMRVNYCDKILTFESTGCWHCSQVIYLRSIGGPYFVCGRGSRREVVCCIYVCWWC